jgi:uncharacterized protein YunC (DUF1805 family)
MTATTHLTPLKSAGYALPLPPRTGNWQIDPTVSYIELRVRELHRTSVLEAPILGGEANVTDTASTSDIQLRLGSAFTRRASTRAGNWMRAAGLDSLEQPLRFDSQLLLASPQGWRMCGRLRAERLDALFVADARIHGVRTQTDGHDGMVITASGTITRARTRELSDALLHARVSVCIHAYLIHD